MIRKNRAQSSSLFLMELILAILFFSITSAVCVQFFVKSHLLSRDAQILNHAVSECSNVAETVDSSQSAESAAALLKELYPTASVSGQNGKNTGVVIYYDEEFTPCGEADHVFSLTADLTQDGSTLNASIRMTANTDSDKVAKGSNYSDGSPVYELNTNYHLAGRAD